METCKHCGRIALRAFDLHEKLQLKFVKACICWYKRWPSTLAQSVALKRNDKP